MADRPTAVLLAGFDSALKFAGHVARALEERGAAVRILAPTTVHPHQLSDEQVAGASSGALELVTWEEAMAAARAADIVVPVYDGSRIDAIFRHIHENTAAGSRPVLGSAYIGMVLYDALHGYLWRSLSDVIAVNSADDLADFSAAARALGMPEDNLVLTGLSLLPAEVSPPRGGPIRRILFADQPTVPVISSSRAYVYERLARYAAAHPDREVVIRPRHRPGEATFHEMRYAPEDYLAKNAVPANLTIDYTPIHQQFPQSDLVLSVSSTAILEALAAGCRVAFVSDFFGENLLNHRFTGSGLLRTFDQLERDEIGTPEPAWLDATFPGSGEHRPAAVFAGRLLELVDDADRPHERAWTAPHSIARRDAHAGATALAARLGLPGPDEVIAAPERMLRRLLRPLPAGPREGIVRGVKKVARRF